MSVSDCMCMFCGEVVAGALSTSVVLLRHQWCLIFLLSHSMACSFLHSDVALPKQSACNLQWFFTDFFFLLVCLYG